MAQIFISYARRDKEIASRISHTLQDSGIDVWFDESSISPGEDWMSSISEGIEKSAAVLFIMTANSIDSQVAYTEIQIGISRNLSIIPLKFDDSPPPIFLSVYQYIDFRRDFNRGMERLIHTIQVIKGVTFKPEPVIDKTPKSKGYVFISYAQPDLGFVDNLIGFLRNRGYAYFDYKHSKRSYVNQFWLELEENIKGAKATISIISPEWKKSRWAVREFLYSEQIRIPVFVVKVKETEPTLVISDLTPIDCIEDVSTGFLALDEAFKDMGLI